jgi:hypothetical protein
MDGMYKLMLILSGLATAAPAMGQQKASFIDGTYVFSPGACAKLKALAAGTTQNASTVPWHVTADGISFWEGGCSFSRIIKGKSKTEWKVEAKCGEGEDESTETYTWRRTSTKTFLVTLTTPGTTLEDRKPVRYTRCSVGPIPQAQ